MNLTALSGNTKHASSRRASLISGVDYDETKWTSNSLTSIGELNDEVFKTPPGFDVPNGSMVLRLVKAVYNMKQGGRVRYEGIRGTSGRWVTNAPKLHVEGARTFVSRLTVR